MSGSTRTSRHRLACHLGVRQRRALQDQCSAGHALRQASAVRAAGPTARPAHSSTHLIEADLDAAFPCFLFLGRCDPTDPLVSRQRRDVGPEAYRNGVGLDGSPEVWRQLMDSAADGRSSSHGSKWVVPCRLTVEMRRAPRRRDGTGTPSASAPFGCCSPIWKVVLPGTPNKR